MTLITDMNPEDIFQVEDGRTFLRTDFPKPSDMPAVQCVVDLKTFYLVDIKYEKNNLREGKVIGRLIADDKSVRIEKPEDG